MTDEPKPHKTEAELKKEEAQRRLQEALNRKQNRPQADHRGTGSKGGGGNAPRFTPAPIRRGPRGG